VEGCSLVKSGPLFYPFKNGLYSQSVYIVLNPAIGAYVQALSAELDFKNAPADLMRRFIDCLVRLPNLKVLEIFNTTGVRPVAIELEWEYVRFPNIRELTVGNPFAKFVESCPNVESITVAVTGDMGPLASYGKELKKLKRVAGVYDWELLHVAQGFPNLQEICITGIANHISSPPFDSRVLEPLRSLKGLAIVDVKLLIGRDSLEDAKLRNYLTEAARILGAWKKCLIEILKDSPSAERKFLRLKVHKHRGYTCGMWVDVGVEELEVGLDKPLPGDVA